MVCNTRNPALLDALGNEMMPFISVAHRDDKRASCATLIEDIENLSKMMASGLWSGKKLLELVGKWPELAVAKTSLGDATIKDVAEYYSRLGYHVEIFTGDQGLKAYEPVLRPTPTPRRRK